MGIVTSTAREAGVVLPVGALVAQLMASANAVGDGVLDQSALLRGRAETLRPQARPLIVPTSLPASTQGKDLCQVCGR